MEDTKTLEQIIEYTKVAEKEYDLAKIISRNHCRSLLIDGNIRKQYNIERTTSLAVIIQHFYELGKADAKEEIIKKIGNESV